MSASVSLCSCATDRARARRRRCDRAPTARGPDCSARRRSAAACSAGTLASPRPAAARGPETAWPGSGSSGLRSRRRRWRTVPACRGASSFLPFGVEQKDAALVGIVVGVAADAAVVPVGDVQPAVGRGADVVGAEVVVALVAQRTSRWWPSCRSRRARGDRRGTRAGRRRSAAARS